MISDGQNQKKIYTMCCKKRKIATASLDLTQEVSNHHYSPSTPHPRVVTKMLPFLPKVMSYPISKVEISVYPT